MTALFISICAVVVVLTLVVVTARVARRMSPPKETWVCRLCDDAFASETSAVTHLAESHHLSESLR